MKRINLFTKNQGFFSNYLTAYTKSISALQTNVIGRNAMRLLMCLVLLLIVQGTAWGQITTLNSWSNVYHNTGNYSASYTIPAGSNTYRVLVVAVASSQTAEGARTVTITYGGQLPTGSVGDMASTTPRQHTQLYYFDETTLDAASGTTLSVAFSGGTTRVNDIFAAVYDGVDQTAPISSSQNYSSGTGSTTSPTWSPVLSVNATDLAVGVISSLRSGSTTPRTFTANTNWTLNNEQTYTTTDGIRNAIASFAIPSSNTTTNWIASISGNALASMTGLSLKMSIPGSTISTTFDYTGSTQTFTVPNCLSSLTIEAWGGGGSGSTRNTNGIGAGGGGGAYVKSTISNPSSTYTYYVGAGSSTTAAGQDSYFGNASTILAKGGNSAADNSNVRVGGQAGSIGDLIYTGGNSAAGTGTNGGGGASSGGTAANGNYTNITTTSQTGASVAGGGSGGNGSTGNANGNNGSVPGGGGGGAYRSSGTRTGGSGANGQIKITYTLPAVPTITLTNPNVSVNFSVSAQNITLDYSATTGCPDKYSIVLDPATAFVTDAPLTSSPITIALPAGLAAGIYNATLTVKNSTYGFVSSGYRISVTVIPPPTITVLPSTLTGFTYPYGYGPSTQQSFVASGVGLTSNIVVLPTDSFEISLSSGVNFVAQTLITLPVINTSVGNTTVYVRMKAGLGVGLINPVTKIQCTSDNAPTKTVSCSGTVTNAPTITVNPSALSNFYYNVNSGPSLGKSFAISGAYLSDTLKVTAPANYEIRKGQTGAFSSSLFYLPTSLPAGSVSMDSIQVRLKSGLLGGIYNGSITLSSTYITKTVTLTGSVNSSYITVSTFVLGGFIYTAGAGPSGAQKVLVSGLYLTGNIILTAPSNFEIKRRVGGTYGATVTLTQSGGTVVPDTIYVRMKAGLSNGLVVSPINLTAVSPGAIQQNVALSGKVVSSSTGITSSSTLTGFVYTLGNGPSVVQSFTVSGTSLSNNITVTPPANFEISLDPGGPFVSTPSTLSIAHSSGNVNAKTVYVKLKAGLDTMTIAPVNIVISSSPAASINVACSGRVIPVPTVIAGTSPSSPICIGTNLNLTSTGTYVTNKYWTGPNGYFYSNAVTPNPNLGAVTPANAGTYTVTGSATSGVNLLTNGSFEDGDIGFGSTYLYVAAGGTIPAEKGAYSVVQYPNTWWNGFCSTCGPQKGTKQMVIDGATTNGKIAWAQSISVIPNENYQFSYWMQSIYTAPFAKVQLFVNGIAVGEQNNAPALASPWAQFVSNINAGSNSVLQLTLINFNYEANGNDFAIDNLEFQQVFTATSSVDLVVNPYLNVSVSIVASTDSVTEGASVTYTAIPVNGGTAPNYQWKVNGVNVGSNSPTLSYIPNDGDIVKCVLQNTTYPCLTNNPATSNEITVKFRKKKNYWKGTQDDDWAKIANWTANFVPLAGDDVVFSPSAVSNLVLDLNNRTIGSLINETNLSTVIPAGKSLIVNQKIIGSESNPDKLILRALNDGTTPNGSLVVFSGCGTTIMATVQLFAKGDKNDNRPNWTDNIVGSPTNGTLFTAKYSWQFFGVPVQSIVAEPTFNRGFLREYDEKKNASNSYYNKWIDLGNSSVLTAFKGYEVTQDIPTIYEIKGKLMLCDQPITLTRSAATVSSSTDPNIENSRYGLGQNVIGNSFTAAMPINQLTFPAGVEQVVYLYNTGSFGSWGVGGVNTEISDAGTYRAIPKNTATAVYKQIPSMQGFLLRHVGTIGTTISMTLPYASLEKNDKPQTAPKAQLSYLEMNLKGSSTMDQLWLFSQEGTSSAFDNGWDGRKFFGRSAAYLFALSEAGNMQVNTTDNLIGTRISFVPDGSKSYEMTIRKSNLEAYSSLYLADLFTGGATELRDELTTYQFTSTSLSGRDQQRFRIVANPDPTSWKGNVNLNAYSEGKNIYLSNWTNELGSMSLYDMSGRKLIELEIPALVDRVIPVNLERGAYVIQLHAGEHQFSTKCIIR